MATGYSDAAPVYYENGWSPLPLPRGEKASPPEGTTGASGRWPTVDEVQLWATQHTNGNVGLRLPDTVLGIDVDDYDGKGGGSSLAELVAKYGPLPDTWVSSSRGYGTSGIRLFRIPAGVRFPGMLGNGIDAIQHHHRYGDAHPRGNHERMIPPPGIFSDAEWARLSEEITAYGGFNPRGEPLYRLVWGGTRTCLRVGVWEGGEIETRQTPKYLTALTRFVMEVWCPPEYFGSPRSWEESTRTEIDGAVVYALGEFPHRGDYEGIEVYQHPRICDCGTPMKKWDWGPKNLIHRRREEHVITKPDGTWDVIQGDWMPHQKPMSCGICGAGRVVARW